MPHSLRAKLKYLTICGHIRKKDYERHCKALDNECALDKIKTEIEQRSYGIANDSVIQGMKYERMFVLKIIDKYKAESEE